LFILLSPTGDSRATIDLLDGGPNGHDQPKQYCAASARDPRIHWPIHPRFSEYLQKVAQYFNLNATELLAYIGIEPPLLKTREYLRKVGLNDRSADFFAEHIEYELNKQRGKSREEPE
jgi:hypothetical protein